MTKTKQYLLGAAALGFIGLAGSWGYLHVTIQSGVENTSAAARRSFPGSGDDVMALVALVQSEAHPLSERNQAVWSLGQMRDPRALPALEAAFTGKPCDHSRFLCQRELAKAIRLCRRREPNLLLVHPRR